MMKSHMKSQLVYMSLTSIWRRKRRSVTSHVYRSCSESHVQEFRIRSDVASKIKSMSVIAYQGFLYEVTLKISEVALYVLMCTACQNKRDI